MKRQIHGRTMGGKTKMTPDGKSQSIEHRCPLNKTLSTKVHKKVAQLQLPLYYIFTSRFLTRENSSRDVLGAFWQDKTIHDRSKRRLLQSIGFQFPCAKTLELWGILDNDERAIQTHLPGLADRAEQESLGHIQARCPVLTKPRITVHHGFGRELLTAINRNSVETRKTGVRSGSFLPHSVRHGQCRY